MHDVLANGQGEVTADGAGSGGGRISGAVHESHDLDGALPFQHQGHHGAGGDELDQGRVVVAALVFGVVGGGEVLVDVALAHPGLVALMLAPVTDLDAEPESAVTDLVLRAFGVDPDAPPRAPGSADSACASRSVMSRSAARLWRTTPCGDHSSTAVPSGAAAAGASTVCAPMFIASVTGQRKAARASA